MAFAFLSGAGIVAAVASLRRRSKGASTADLEAIASRSSDALLRLDADLRCTYASPAATRLTGLPPQMLIGQRVLDALPAEGAAAFAAAVARARAGWDGAEAVFRPTAGAGEPRWIEARLSRIEADGGIVAVLRDISTRRTSELALRVANAELTRLAGTDPLTELANRRRFDQTVESACRRSTRQGVPLSLLLIHVQRFEAFTRRYGQAAGDACLRRIGAAIRGTLDGPADLAARFAGEEFAVLLPGRPAGEALLVAERIRAVVAAQSIRHDGNLDGGGFASVAVGAATIEAGQHDAERETALLVAAAHRALHDRRPASAPLPRRAAAA